MAFNDIISAMTIPPSAADESVLETFYDILDNAGILSELDLLYVTGLHDRQASRLNWINPAAGTLVEYGSPAWTKYKGFKGNSSSAYLTPELNYSDLTNLTLDDASMFAYIVGGTNAAADKFVLGRETGAGYNSLRPRAASGGAIKSTINSASTSDGNAQSDIKGLTHVNRTASNAVQFYKNGAAAGTDNESTHFVSSGNIVILRHLTTYSDFEVGVVGFGASLDATQAQVLNDAIEYLYGNLGKVENSFSKIFVSQTGWNPEERPLTSITTPLTAHITAGGYYDTDQLEAPDPVPGVYQWGIIGYQVNTGTAPCTGLFGRARGHSAYSINGTARGYGKNAKVHGIETLVGAHSSKATASRTNGSAVLTGIQTLTTEDGSRFEVGMPISGTGIPNGATITAVSGRAGAPTQITMSANATSTGNSEIVCQPVSPDTLGILITGNGGTEDGGGNPNGRAIHIQAYNQNSKFLTGLHFGGTALQDADGVGVKFVNVTARAGFEAGTTNSFNKAAIYLEGQNIATDTTNGMKIGTASNQKIGFWGKTPVAQPAAIENASGDAEAKLNQLLAALRSIGIIAT